MRGIQVPVATTLCGAFDPATGHQPFDLAPNLVRDLTGKQLREFRCQCTNSLAETARCLRHKRKKGAPLNERHALLSLA